MLNPRKAMESTMKIIINVTASEMMAIGSICNLFEDEPISTHKNRLIEEITQHTIEHSTWNEDGSYEYRFEASELISICAINWLRDIIAQFKGLILSAADTCKNIIKMKGLKKLIIDGEEQKGVCKKVMTKMCIDDMNIRVVTHPHQEVSDEEEKKRVTEKVTAALKKPVTE